MITPFQYEGAEAHLHTLLEKSGKKEISLIIGTCILLNDFDRGAYRVGDEELLRQEYEMWINGCVLDAVMNQSGYQDSFDGNHELEALFSEVVVKLLKSYDVKFSLARVPKLMMRMGIASVIRVLRRMLDETKRSPLAERFRQNGQYDAWKEEIIRLHNLLAKHVTQEDMDSVNNA